MMMMTVKLCGLSEESKSSVSFYQSSGNERAPVVASKDDNDCEGFVNDEFG